MFIPRHRRCLRTIDETKWICEKYYAEITNYVKRILYILLKYSLASFLYFSASEHSLVTSISGSFFCSCCFSSDIARFNLSFV